MSVVPLGWRFSCHLECGVNRNAMATCQYDGVYPDGKTVCWLHRFPLKEKLRTHKTLGVQNGGTSGGHLHSTTRDLKQTFPWVFHHAVVAGERITVGVALEGSV